MAQNKKYYKQNYPSGNLMSVTEVSDGRAISYFKEGDPIKFPCDKAYLETLKMVEISRSTFYKDKKNLV